MNFFTVLCPKFSLTSGISCVWLKKNIINLCVVSHYEAKLLSSFLNVYGFEYPKKTCLRTNIQNIHNHRAHSAKVSRWLFSSKPLDKKQESMVKILNVAEKNDAAKHLSEIMSKGRYKRREGLSKFNKIYEFEYYILNQKCAMMMTSVSGHLLNLEFVGAYRKWNGCNPLALFEAPIARECPQEYIDIKRTLEREVRGCNTLIIWTDGDREGENIGFEIIEVCKNVKPNIQVYRARFSEITQQAVSRACQNLVLPDQCQNDAVYVRRELDLRIGAAFTRFQTLRLKKVFPEVLSDQLISYGSCQFPTLGFVVERYKQVQAFVPEPFWKIKVSHQKEDGAVDFSWKRGRLFDHTACLVLYQICLENPTATVLGVKTKPKSKWRPLPLDTTELEKTASRKLKITAKETMRIAEKLYTKGFISYPRTETNSFPKDLNLRSLVEMQTEDPNWGGFAAGILQQGPNPRQGSKSDNAHPPIHPTKYTNSLEGNDRRIYEFIVRHFLAVLSQDAQGLETTVDIEIAGEKFSTSGLIITAKNYLEVYPYDKWNTKVIPNFTQGEMFQPSSIEMVDGETSPPALLTEADLIALMEKHGIGTDATHAEHIETIKSRFYVGLNPEGRFIPGELGMGLVEGYDLMGFEMSKPHLRAEFEADLKRICEGTRNPQVVLQEQIQKYRAVFVEAMDKANRLDEALAQYIGEAQEFVPDPVEDSGLQPVMKCPRCGSADIVIRNRKNGQGFFLSCMGFPQCRSALWLPGFVENIMVENSLCSECHPQRVQKLHFKVKRGSLSPFYPDEFSGCLGGCDTRLMETLGVRPLSNPNIESHEQSERSFQSGIHGNNSRRNDSYCSTTGDSGFESVGSGNFSADVRAIYSQNSTTTNVPPQGLVSSFHNNGIALSSQRTPVSRAVLRPLNQSNMPGQLGQQDIVCKCGETALLLTVKKNGPNMGRQFYRCGKKENECNFFMWADDSITPMSSGQDFLSPPNDNNLNSGVLNHQDVHCQCGGVAKLLTVQKEGPNKGRQFYVCAKPQGQQCQFFQWADGIVAGSSFSASRGESRGARRPTTVRSTGKNEKQGTKRKRRCGVCGQEGHTRKSCPMNR
ncbi:DNA topoisomerase 3-alpha-like [Limulus polyphemus]|uniref:DNA topoisomerase n=1 Tax=Limulus polyphemus TaxID=6850 RepID=A0ABM1SX47_LIMPO|nr:DNA topoisomerase 3-alpha-like [Limulus polyphemus]XP_022248203.1 DNA topoisomerase 3-alpha-like [Limulus polyphemus]